MEWLLFVAVPGLETYELFSMETEDGEKLNDGIIRMKARIIRKPTLGDGRVIVTVHEIVLNETLVSEPMLCSYRIMHEPPQDSHMVAE